MKKILIFFFLIFFTINAKCEEKIAYIDLDRILNMSDVGVYVNKHLKFLEEDKNKQFELIENNLKILEKRVLSKKNILNDENFLKETENFNKKIIEHNNNKKKYFESFNKKKIKYTNEILKSLDNIISNYIELNSISILFSLRFKYLRF